MAAYDTMLRPDVVVVTSIGSEHHRSLGTLDVTQAEKSRMVEALAASGTAILNADDPRVAAMAARCAGRVIRFGIDAEARATDVAIDWPYGTRVTLRIGQTERLVRLRLLGRVMVYPFLAAMSVAQAEGLPLGQAITALEAIRRGAAACSSSRCRAPPGWSATTSSRRSRRSTPRSMCCRGYPVADRGDRPGV